MLRKQYFAMYEIMLQSMPLKTNINALYGYLFDFADYCAFGRNFSRRALGRHGHRLHRRLGRGGVGAGLGAGARAYSARCDFDHYGGDCGDCGFAAGRRPRLSGAHGGKYFAQKPEKHQFLSAHGYLFSHHFSGHRPHGLFDDAGDCGGGQK